MDMLQKFFKLFGTFKIQKFYSRLMHSLFLLYYPLLDRPLDHNSGAISTAENLVLLQDHALHVLLRLYRATGGRPWHPRFHVHRLRVLLAPDRFLHVGFMLSA